jgi:hypothetical protein
MGELTHRIVLLQVVNSGVAAGPARQQGQGTMETAAAVALAADCLSLSRDGCIVNAAKFLIG